jgi:hypothetical protein
MIATIFTFLAGFLLFPILYALLPSVVSEIGKRRRFKIQQKSNLYITDTLKKYIDESTAKCFDTSWLNVVVQRMYAEMVKNYAFETRIKNNMLKHFSSALKIGIIKNVTIRELELGREAPYIKNIQVLTKGEYESLLKSADTHDEIDIIAMGETLGIEIGSVNIADSDEIVSEMSHAERSPLYKHINMTCPDIANEEEQSQIEDSPPVCKLSAKDENNTQTIEFIDDKKPKVEPISDSNHQYYQDTFKNLLCLFNVEYYGGLRISLDVELPQKIFVNSTVIIKGFKGDAILRLPAENYDTRYEISFVKEPNFEIEVESGINTGKNKIFFQNSVSKFLKSAIKYSIRKTIILPNWLQQFQGYLPSSRDIVHKVQKLSPETLDEAAAVTEAILTYLSSDFKIIAIKHDIYQRKSSTTINESDHIYLSHFKIPKIADISISSDFVVFEGLDIQDSKLMNRFLDLSILDGVISGFKSLRQICSCKNYTLVALEFSDKVYEFIRIVYKDYLIFQRNDTVKSDFFVFRILDKELQIFSYSTTSDYDFTPRRIEKLKKKLFSEPMSILGSNLLYKFMHIGRKTKFTPQNLQPNKYVNTEKTLGVTELEDIFQNTLEIDDDELESKKAAFSTHKKHLFEFISDDNLRMKLFSETARICNIIKESDKIKTLIIENTIQSHNFGIKESTEEIIIHTYTSEECIVDICIEKDLIFIYRVAADPAEDYSDNKSVLNIITKKSMNVKYPNYFLEALQIKISTSRFLKPMDQIEYCRAESRFSKELKTTKGAAYFEFKTEFEDDFQFQIVSCKKEAPIFEIYKVISNKTFQLLIPTENDFLKFTLTPKHRRNKFIQYKLQNLEVERDIYVSANIGLGPNCKFVLPMKGFPTHVIFWEKDCLSHVESYLEDYDARDKIDKCGLIRAECKDYWLIYKNKEKKKRNIKLFVGMALKE